MTALQLYTDFKPQITIFVTVLVAYISIRLLGDPLDPLKEFLKWVFDEIKALFNPLLNPMMTLNAWGMVLYFIMASGIVMSSTLQEFVGFSHDKPNEPVEIAKIGATCFLALIFVVGLLLSVKLSKMNRDLN